MYTKRSYKTVLKIKKEKSYTPSMGYISLFLSGFYLRYWKSS